MLLIIFKLPRIHCWPLNRLVDLWAQEKKSYAFFQAMCVLTAWNWIPLLLGLRGAAGNHCALRATGRGEGRFLGGLVLHLTNSVMRASWRIHFTSWLWWFCDVPTPTQLHWTTLRKLYRYNCTSRGLFSVGMLQAWLSKAERRHCGKKFLVEG